MQDPYYARIIFAVESHIHDFDLKSKADEDLELKDSDIKSALRKAMGMLRGARSLQSPKDERERLKGALALELIGIYECAAKTERPSRQEFVDSLLAIEDTLKLRREMGGHSRGYLEFLKNFIPDVRGNRPNKGEQTDASPPP